MSGFARYICARCSAALRAKVISDSPICRRCTGLCKPERIDDSAPDNFGTKVLGRAMPRIQFAHAIRQMQKEKQQ